MTKLVRLKSGSLSKVNTPFSKVLYTIGLEIASLTDLDQVLKNDNNTIPKSVMAIPPLSLFVSGSRKTK